MPLEMRTLSLWELAHRLHDHDPNLSTKDVIPLPVQDTLRSLTYMLAYSELNISNEYGREFENLETIASLEEFWMPGELTTIEEVIEVGDGDSPTLIRGRLGKRAPDDPENPSYTLEEREQAYEAFLESRLRGFYELIDGFEEIYHYRRYDIQKLTFVHLTKEQFAKYCIIKQIPRPNFWYTEESFEHYKQYLITGGDLADAETPASLQDDLPLAEGELPKKASQLYRLLCRAIAQTLWDIDPTMTIEAMRRHHAMLYYGNSRKYPGEKTLRNWINDLDPRSPEERNGRPKKKSAP